jgi:hypothetical protein
MGKNAGTSRCPLDYSSWQGALTRFIGKAVVNICRGNGSMADRHGNLIQLVNDITGRVDPRY